MKNLKRAFLRTFFCIEACIFIFTYIFGAHGITTVRQLKNTNELLGKEIDNLQQEVGLLEHQVIAWRSDPFFKEKIARERLHMARRTDVIYYTKA